MAIYMLVGRNCDPYYLNEIFQVSEVAQIDKSISEDEIFASIQAEDGSASAYLTALQGIINQIRY